MAASTRISLTPNHGGRGFIPSPPPTPPFPNPVVYPVTLSLTGFYYASDDGNGCTVNDTCVDRLCVGDAIPEETNYTDPATGKL